MLNTLRDAIESMARLNVYVYLGSILLLGFTVTHHFLYMRLRRTGYSKSIFDFLLVEIPSDYLQARSQYGWSPWPAYLVFPQLIAGLVLFVLGVFKL